MIFYGGKRLARAVGRIANLLGNTAHQPFFFRGNVPAAVENAVHRAAGNAAQFGNLLNCSHDCSESRYYFYVHEHIIYDFMIMLCAFPVNSL